MKKEKLWCECSKEEKAEVRAIEKERERLKEQFRSGEISHRKYSYRLTMLIKKTYDIERKYND